MGHEGGVPSGEYLPIWGDKASHFLQVIDGFVKSIDDTSKIKDFIMPVNLPQVAGAMLSADKILYIIKPQN